MLCLAGRQYAAVCAPESAARVKAAGEIELAQGVDALRRRYEMLDAEAAARSALERFPGSVEILIALGRVLLAAHRLADAFALFSQAGELAPEYDRPISWQIAALSGSIPATKRSAPDLPQLNAFQAVFSSAWRWGARSWTPRDRKTRWPIWPQQLRSLPMMRPLSAGMLSA